MCDAPSEVGIHQRYVGPTFRGVPVPDESIAEHYTAADLEERILAVLSEQGRDIEHLSTDDIVGVDEFPVEGRASTVRVLEQLDLRPGLRILDIGSGLVGPRGMPHRPTTSTWLASISRRSTSRSPPR